jgi:glycosyltransferase involved in cell wall biosynthesis
MSAHEGFGVPLVEAMLMGVPVVAYRSTAVSFTLGGAGIEFATKDVALVSEIVHRVVEDSHLRSQVITRQRERARDFAPEVVLPRLRSFVSPRPVSP